MRVLFLGTGTSAGVPVIGCDCEVCRSSDPRDVRLRPSILIEMDDGLRVLVDTTPDLRQQALTFGVRRVDAVLFTHTHADHVMGLDEIRRFNYLAGGPMAVFGAREALDEIRRMFRYAFESGGDTWVPKMQLWPIGGAFSLGRQVVVPVPVMHGSAEILGFRVGRFAYLTDCSGIPESSQPLLGDLDVLVLDALRHRPHPTHFTVAEASEVAGRLGARQTYFTHICHDLAHEATCASLPPGMALAYDGLALDIAQA